MMRFMHCPTHVGEEVEHNLHSVNAIEPDSVGFTEMDPGTFPSPSIRAARRILRRYRICTDAKNIGPHSQEVPIAVRRSLLTRVQSTTVIHLSPKVARGGISQDRYATVVRIRRPLFRLAHVAIHTNAAIQGPQGQVLRNRRAQVTKDAMVKLESVLSSLINDEHREVVCSGDFNYRDHPNQPGFRLWDHSPQAVFDRLRMNRYDDGLDHVGWTRRLRLVRPVRTIPPGTALNGSDHPWLVLDLRYRRRRKATTS